MRWALAASVCGLALLAGCGGSSIGANQSTSFPQSPTASAGGPYSGTAGTALRFNGAGSTDPQGQPLTYIWNFGDGGTGTGVSPTHAYAAAGVYEVTLGVTDSSNLGGNASTQAVIAGLGAGGGASGGVYDGNQPIVGAHVYLLAANRTGYGQPSVSLMNAVATGHSDALGAYVLTGTDGGFLWTGAYSCTPGAQVYVYSLGGVTSAGTNSAAGLMTVLGSCPSAGNFAALPFVWVNEVSTVAAAYALAGFATDATHVSSSGTALAQTGIANAFANVANLSPVFAGVALTVTPAGNGVVPQSEINTLANILSACVGSSGPASTSCSLLFANAKSNGSSGTAPADTATAAINIAHNPGAQIGPLYSISSGAAPFTPVLTGRPYDFTLAIVFTGGGLHTPSNIAIDASGNVWVANLNTAALSEFNSSGAAMSSATGYSGGGLAQPTGIAIDASGDAWVANLASEGLSEFSPTSVALSPANGFADCGGVASSHGVAVDGADDIWFTDSRGGGGCVTELSDSGMAISSPGGFPSGSLDQVFGIAIDGSGAVWVTNQGANNVAELSSSGMLLSPPAGYIGGGLNVPDGIAIDNGGNAWIVNAGNSSLTEISSSGAVLSPGNGFTGGGLYQPEAIAVDGSGNVWAANYKGENLSEFNNDGVAISGTDGYALMNLRGPDGIAIDGSGDVWVAAYDGSSLVEFIGAATPVVTPLAAGVKNNTLGARP